jgi:undecaprenyl diphosphate synthase
MTSLLIEPDIKKNLTEELPVPQHIAFIMDGNRRWAKQRGLPSSAGHWKGANVLHQTVRTAADMGVKVVTAYAFSTENWNRTESEVHALMDLFDSYLLSQRDLMVEEGVRLDMIGDPDRLPSHVRKTFEETKRATAGGDRIDLVLAINYGGRDEIRRAAIRLLEEYQDRPFPISALTEGDFAQHLDTSRWPDPDLLIRTSGVQRLSNFLLWQFAYSEIYVTDVLWPDFSVQELSRAVQSYHQRRRNRGV